MGGDIVWNAMLHSIQRGMQRQSKGGFLKSSFSGSNTNADFQGLSLSTIIFYQAVIKRYAVVLPPASVANPAISSERPKDLDRKLETFKSQYTLVMENIKKVGLSGMSEDSILLIAYLVYLSGISGDANLVFKSTSQDTILGAILPLFNGEKFILPKVTTFDDPSTKGVNYLKADFTLPACELENIRNFFRGIENRQKSNGVTISITDNYTGVLSAPLDCLFKAGPDIVLRVIIPKLIGALPSIFKPVEQSQSVVKNLDAAPRPSFKR